MKTKHWLIPWLAVWGMMALAPTRADETATVQGSRVNVRGQPSLVGEVITQLKAGETISILETITVPQPKAGEPTNWFRIQMPANTPVWVHRSFIEATNKTVRPPKLNVRAGPGENFSVVGRLLRGETVKEIRVVDDWMEIETPSSAYAFVSAEWIQKTAADKPAAPVIAPVTPPVAPPAAPPVVTALPVIEKPEPAAPPLPIQVQIETLPPEPTVATPTPPLPVAEPIIAPPEPVNLPPVVPPPPRAEEKSTRRVVAREGIVRSTISIQAPTYYELVSPQTRKTINYLHSSSTNLVLKTFRGLRVLAAGEEFLDARWPNTPVLEVETVELAP